MNNKLSARVAAQNKANQVAISLYNQFIPVFRPLVGQKIIKTNGDLLLKIELPNPSFPNGVRFYRNNSKYTLSWTVSVSEQVDDRSCIYQEATVYIGDFGTDYSGQSNVLIKLYDEPKYRTDYSASDIQQKRAAYKAAKALADQALGELFPFGEYDH